MIQGLGWSLHISPDVMTSRQAWVKQKYRQSSQFVRIEVLVGAVRVKPQKVAATQEVSSSMVTTAARSAESPKAPEPTTFADTSALAPRVLPRRHFLNAEVGAQAMAGLQPLPVACQKSQSTP